MSYCEDCEAPRADCDCVIPRGRMLPFVQTGMLVHCETCSNCERGGDHSFCTWIVSDIYEATDEYMEAKLTLKNGTRCIVTCRDLRHGWRLAANFDQRLTYTGEWTNGPALAAEVAVDA